MCTLVSVKLYITSQLFFFLHLVLLKSKFGLEYDMLYFWLNKWVALVILVSWTKILRLDAYYYQGCAIAHHFSKRLLKVCIEKNYDASFKMHNFYLGKMQKRHIFYIHWICLIPKRGGGGKKVFVKKETVVCKSLRRRDPEFKKPSNITEEWIYWINCYEDKAYQ